jgi:DNA-binding protein H-NS
MATAKKVPRSDLMTQIQTLAKQQKRLESDLMKSQGAELKRLVAEFRKNLKAGKLTVEDAVKVLSGTKAGRPKKGGKRGAKVAKAPKLYESGITYKKPRGNETWVGGTKGRQPAWLKELIAGGRTFESLAVKK